MSLCNKINIQPFLIEPLVVKYKIDCGGLKALAVLQP